MKFFISYQELQNIIYQKSGKSINICAGNENDNGSVNVLLAYTMEITVPFLGNRVTKNIEMSVSFNGIKDTQLDICYNVLSKGMDLVLLGIRTFLNEQIERSGLLKWGAEKNQVILNLEKLAEKMHIDGVDKITNLISINGIRATDEGIEVFAVLKSIG